MGQHVAASCHGLTCSPFVLMSTDMVPSKELLSALSRLLVGMLRRGLGDGCRIAVLFAHRIVVRDGAVVCTSALIARNILRPTCVNLPNRAILSSHQLGA